MIAEAHHRDVNAEDAFFPWRHEYPLLEFDRPQVL